MLSEEELLKLCAHFLVGYGSISKIAQALKSRLTTPAEPTVAVEDAEVAEIEKRHKDDERNLFPPPSTVSSSAARKVCAMHRDRATLLRKLRAPSSPAIFEEVLTWLKANKLGQNYWKRMEAAIAATPAPGAPTRDAINDVIQQWALKLPTEIRERLQQRHATRLIDALFASGLLSCTAPGVERDSSFPATRDIISKRIREYFGQQGHVITPKHGDEIADFVLTGTSGLLARVLSIPVEYFKQRHREKAAAGITRAPETPAAEA